MLSYQNVFCIFQAGDCNCLQNDRFWGMNEKQHRPYSLSCNKQPPKHSLRCLWASYLAKWMNHISTREVFTYHSMKWTTYQQKCRWVVTLDQTDKFLLYKQVITRFPHYCNRTKQKCSHEQCLTLVWRGFPEICWKFMRWNRKWYACWA